MNKYYLIARNKDTNDFKIIKLKKSWYSDDSNNDEVLKANPLEAIDLVTTKFSSVEEMAGRMKNNGYIKTSNVDIFIVNKNKYNQLIINDIIYNHNNSLLIKYLQSIAKALLKKDIKSEQDKIKYIYKELAEILFNDTNGSFSSFFYSKYCNISETIKDFYEDCETSKDFKNVPYKNSWMLVSYLNIRNIVKLLNNFSKKSENCTSYSRKLIINEILKRIDENYIDGQFNLFDLGLTDTENKYHK